jgi:hypothetical protein
MEAPLIHLRAGRARAQHRHKASGRMHALLQQNAFEVVQPSNLAKFWVVGGSQLDSCE